MEAMKEFAILSVSTPVKRGEFYANALSFITNFKGNMQTLSQVDVLDGSTSFQEDEYKVAINKFAISANTWNFEKIF